MSIIGKLAGIAARHVVVSGLSLMKDIYVEKRNHKTSKKTQIRIDYNLLHDKTRQVLVKNGFGDARFYDEGENDCEVLVADVHSMLVIIFHQILKNSYTRDLAFSDLKEALIDSFVTSAQYASISDCKPYASVKVDVAVNEILDFLETKEFAR